MSRLFGTVSVAIVILSILISLNFTITEVESVQQEIETYTKSLNEKFATQQYTLNNLADHILTDSSFVEMSTITLISSAFRNNLKLTGVQIKQLFRHIYWESRRANVDPNLIYSLIEAESAWHIDAVSHKGAIGLMQVMHNTARLIDPDIERVQLMNPFINISIGIQWFGIMMTENNSRPLDALSEYNTGKKLSTPNDYARNIMRVTKMRIIERNDG